MQILKNGFVSVRPDQMTAQIIGKHLKDLGIEGYIDRAICTSL